MEEGGEEKQAKQELNQANSSTKTASNCQTLRFLKKSQKRVTSRQTNVLQDFSYEAEEAASKGDLKTLYANTRVLKRRHCNPSRPVKKQKRKAAYNPTTNKRLSQAAKMAMGRPHPTERA